MRQKFSLIVTAWVLSACGNDLGGDPYELKNVIDAPRY